MHVEVDKHHPVAKSRVPRSGSYYGTVKLWALWHHTFHSLFDLCTPQEAAEWIAMAARHAEGGGTVDWGWHKSNLPGLMAATDRMVVDATKDYLVWPGAYDASHTVIPLSAMDERIRNRFGMLFPGFITLGQCKQLLIEVMCPGRIMPEAEFLRRMDDIRNAGEHYVPQRLRDRRA